ncbi:hypothetical protein KDW98_09190 [Burkholderia vietnamiensis]|uniref:hypothetical protein n=1 Tax=Burkholderia vietnamiensis TaxID=60552 RepID=UPI001B956EEB|nr:hypothetical protein [Burkholderia vietnamiensis]MBR8161345.1 hypothetical protein [Burkholderia vietnamiensis]MCA8147866.1 hypothetical protein [Burkholderia vietnamiensis]
MPTPLQAMTEWFEAQPQEVQSHAGFLMYWGIAKLIGDKTYEPGASPDNAFLEWLKQPSDGAYDGLAKTLLAREHIRFTMIDGLCTQKSWDEALENNQALLEGLKGHPDEERMKSTPLKVIAELPARSAMFIKSGDEWRQNVAIHVTDAAIRKWRDDESFKAIKQARTR